jgi:hypothetical protein
MQIKQSDINRVRFLSKCIDQNLETLDDLGEEKSDYIVLSLFAELGSNISELLSILCKISVNRREELSSQDRGV